MNTINSIYSLGLVAKYFMINDVFIQWFVFISAIIVIIHFVNPKNTDSNCCWEYSVGCGASNFSLSYVMCQIRSFFFCVMCIYNPR